MADIPCGDHRMTRQRDTRNLRITDIHRSPGPLSIRRKRSSLGCGSGVKVQYAVFQIVFE